MPDHIHAIIILDSDKFANKNQGTSKAPSPTNEMLPHIISTFKRFCNSQYGHNIWQARSYDHIIRDEKDYLKIWNYIDCNPGKWTEDCFYME